LDALQETATILFSLSSVRIAEMMAQSGAPTGNICRRKLLDKMLSEVKAKAKMQ
jgi:hypothetical protein